MNMPQAPHRPPLFLLLLGIITVVSLGLGVANAVTQQHATDRRLADQEAANHQRCLFGVEGRNDNRAVWLYLISLTPPSPKVSAFAAFIDERLPELKCVNDILVPKETP